ncbi:hypothetical protein GCM10027037_00990 [Mucilaginibacter koreensis]
MAKMFTITAGLENMGALSTGGQGSVYKAKRMGPVMVAVKLLPTPIQTESDEDKNYKDFRNEVEKLKRVNQEPNPHVVKILSSGITESGALPYIEMEFIEGPDLAELLKPPHAPVFTISEIIKVADQLANALNHCHLNEVKHGDIKSNNVKWNSQTGNYILLDFGLAVMSNEQRRSSLRHAGAVEFMAPEQSEGMLLYQSDIYSYGIILYELLTGAVPFPMKDNGHTARSSVMLSHLEAQPPEPLAQRKAQLPVSWPAEKQAAEMQVPAWLLEVMFRCLEKDPAKRFANGTDLYHTITSHKTADTTLNNRAELLTFENENKKLQETLLQQQTRLQAQEQEIERLKVAIYRKEQETEILHAKVQMQQPVNPAVINNPSAPPVTPAKQTPSPWLTALVILILIAACTAYFIYRSKPSTPTTEQANTTDAPSTKSASKQPASSKRHKSRPASTQSTTTDTYTPTAKPGPDNDIGKTFTLSAQYAYFHNKPEPESRRKANINIWNNARITALDDQNGYIYVVYKNEQGQISRGWLDKSDLKLME